MTTHPDVRPATRAVDTYLERIGYRGDVTPGVDVLRALHRAHLATVPFENLDVHLGAVVPLDRAAILDKVVARRRGGYCFELNTAFGALLEALGFEVSLACAAIGPRDAEEPLWGNHMALLVRVDGGTWVADVGMGQGFVEPLPLRPGPHDRAGFDFEVARDDHWWVGLHRFGRLPGYLLREEPHELEWFEPHHQRQSTDPESSFVRRLLAQRPHDDHVLTLVGTKLFSNGPAGGTEVPVETAEEFAAVLAERFDVPVADVDTDRLFRFASAPTT
ncbi:arylamine N-acetyltransferase [Umezawaea sp. Da 62-37]|uniref:arylamine N-acetyltransferase family protein n=1 Tax=Umezawaea sp. Da 62-37 TaxID=3075927 RepID=UPI0028F6E41C|nr:arylamine N-acetyltransferase [Umezawaea sp. Da 62-37]WNV86958.1 arylamine N-acetyltransferase [Umezawaea sp. Da 62-37]